MVVDEKGAGSMKGRALRTAGWVLGVSLLTTGCGLTKLLLQPEQRRLVKNQMQMLEAGQKQLEDSLKQGRWDALARISDEMAETARHLETVSPKRDKDDFRIRAIELEHDLTLMSKETRWQDDSSVRTGLKNMQFTCDSCHRKFKHGRPW
jgi:hypothetical protein